MSRALVPLLLALLLGPEAWAHPYGSKFHSMRHELRLGERDVEAVVVLEVPTQVVLRAYQKRYSHAEISTEDAERDFLSWWCGRLTEGLSLTVDGQPAKGRWQQADHPSNGRGGEEFFVYIVRFAFDEAPAQDRAVELVLDNASLPKARTYFSAYAQADAPWRVATNSARELIGGKADVEEVSEDPAAWTQDEAARSLRVVFER